MKNLIHTAVVTLFAASAAHAQQAVQWKVSDGGNGHWYRVIVSGSITWDEARTESERLGGHLATVTNAEEDTFAASVASVPSAWNFDQGFGPWLGGYQSVTAQDFAEPAGGWRWVTSESWSWAAWNAASYDEPNECTSCCGSAENFLHYKNRSANVIDRIWNDLASQGVQPCGQPVAFVIEWDGDCNNDNIVDYGQCRDGTLKDYDGNNIPDCCERGDACVVGNYPVQWRIDDGGNGHWYQLRTQGLTIAWQSADAVAKADGGYLASILSEDEDIFVFRLSDTPGAWQGPLGPWLGGAQIPGSGEPVGTWIWLSSGDPWTYAGPNSDFADNGSGVDENRLHYVDHARRWNDIAEDGFPEYFGGIRSLLIEWSADCNNDGGVDYGQILQGQLVDANTNGIPDICEGITCVDADIYRDFNVNGADLGILLSQWGPNTPLTESDLNKDGFVNGADLGLLLAFWGPCPN